ncbi:hypothetical protein DFH06DRAFT_1148134 [Mycena polygramma]|nr:hypothetical protein DFH06DRAFT_1148134 [Mycena polygramma]
MRILRPPRNGCGARLVIIPRPHPGSNPAVGFVVDCLLLLSIESVETFRMRSLIGHHLHSAAAFEIGALKESRLQTIIYDPDGSYGCNITPKIEGHKYEFLPGNATALHPKYQSYTYKNEVYAYAPQLQEEDDGHPSGVWTWDVHSGDSGGGKDEVYHVDGCGSGMSAYSESDVHTRLGSGSTTMCLGVNNSCSFLCPSARRWCCVTRETMQQELGLEGHCWCMAVQVWPSAVG